MEKIFRRPDGQTINDKRGIDRLYKQIDFIREQRAKTSPPEVLKDIDLAKATLTRRNLPRIGTLEIYGGSERPYPNYLFEIPDITIDLTPEAKDLPRRKMGFVLSAGDRKITIGALFDETAKEYWKHYGNEKQIKKDVSANLMTCLQESRWRFGIYAAWSVVK